MASDLDATAAARLAAVDQRYTDARRRLVAVLGRHRRPLSIAEIRDRDRSLAQSSLYRNLAVLEQAGVVHRVAGGDGLARYELAEDLTGHHHHLVCASCGSVEDVAVPGRLERTVAQGIAEIAARAGFEVHHHRLDLIGRCARCAPPAGAHRPRARR
jgi:Fe2+ or Zn2+ uptake regulation protein